MVAPKYGPTRSSSSDNVQDPSSLKSDQRRREILLSFVQDAVGKRMQGNTLFKDRLYDQALTKYSDAIHTLRKASGGLKLCYVLWAWAWAVAVVLLVESDGGGETEKIYYSVI